MPQAVTIHKPWRPQYASMPLYFHHFRTCEGALIVDHDGIEHADDEAAIHEASLSAGALMHSARPHAGGAFEVHDAAGWLVETVPVRTY